MNFIQKTYCIIPLLVFVLIGCRQSKYIAEGQYLLKENEISFELEEKGEEVVKNSHPILSSSEIYELVKPVPNLKLKLFFYNRIDTVKHKKQVEKKSEKYRRKNEKRKIKENKINNKRIKKAEERGDSLYRHKVIRPKSVKLGWRDGVRKRLGQAPIALDTNRAKKSKKQIEIYLKKKGFYTAKVKDTIIYNEKKRWAKTGFIIDAGTPYRIREIKFDSTAKTAGIYNEYKKMIEKEGALLESGNLLDEEVLDNERERFTKYGRDEGALFGFNRNYVGFVVDTTVGDLQADVIIYIKPKIIDNPYNEKEKIEVPHKTFKVRNAVFRLHNPDEASFKDYEAYKKKCDALNLPYRNDSDKGRFQLLDTLFIYGKGRFIYNEKPFLDPDLLDKQNFLEIDRSDDSLNPVERYYKEYYIERSYRTMSQLEVFSNISPEIVIDPEEPLGRWLIVTYDLTPLKKQSFLFEPRLSNTNGILGTFGTVGYTNKNLFGGAQKLQLSFIGGLESQPLIVGLDGNGEEVQSSFGLNTFEWGPKASLILPKLAPLPKKLQDQISKRSYPKTTLNLAVNFQKRAEFKRTLTQLGYEWSFQQDKVQRWEIALIEIDFVRLEKETFFQERLDLLNDPSILNSYTDHLTTILRPVYHYSNINSNKRDHRNLHDIVASVDLSGFLLTPLIYNGLENSSGQVGLNLDSLKSFFNVPYTQFLKFDLQYILSQYLNKKNKFVFRAIAGAGFASGNSLSLPYEQAFFAGGSNDLRAFQARTVAPGTVQTYADNNATTTQIGDLKLETNLEWRFKMTSLFEGAVFADIGNIWNIAYDGEDVNAPGIFQFDRFYKELSIGLGYGLRADLDFLIVRLDLAFALHDPHLPEGERWWLSDKTEYRSFFDVDINGDLVDFISPHPLQFNFGIGYPF